MATLSLDLRERILHSYDHEEGTRENIAKRYRVSLGMVKKLLQQRRNTGSIKARHHLAGRKPVILPKHRIAIRRELKRKSDLTLVELRDILGLTCTIQALHYVLIKMGLTYKKRRCVRPNKTEKTSVKRVRNGSVSKEVLNHGGKFPLMKAGRKPT